MTDEEIYTDNALRGYEVDELKAENARLHADAATVVHALDAAIQWGEMLFAFLPEGTPMHPNVTAAKSALDAAMAAIRYPSTNPALKIAAANIARLNDYGTKLTEAVDKSLVLIDVLLSDLRASGHPPSPHLVIARDSFDEAIKKLFANNPRPR